MVVGIICELSGDLVYMLMYTVAVECHDHSTNCSGRLPNVSSPG